MWWECDNLFLISNQSGCARGLVHILPLLWRHREFSRVAGKRVAKAVLRVAPQDPLVRVVLDTMYSSVHQSNLIHVQGVPCPRRPGLGWLRFGGFPRLVGRYCSYLLPKQGGGTSQIQVNITQSTRTWDALYFLRETRKDTLAKIKFAPGIGKTNESWLMYASLRANCIDSVVFVFFLGLLDLWSDHSSAISFIFAIWKLKPSVNVQEITSWCRRLPRISSRKCGCGI